MRYIFSVALVALYSPLQFVWLSVCFLDRAIRWCQEWAQTNIPLQFSHIHQKVHLTRRRLRVFSYEQYASDRNQGHLVNWGWFLALAHEQNVSKGSLTIINRWQGLCNQTRLNIFPVNVLETGQKFYNPLFHSPEFSIPHRANDFLEDIKRFSDFKKTQRRFNPLPRMAVKLEWLERLGL